MALRQFSTSASRKLLSPLARTSAERLSEWKGTSVTGGTTKNFIGGEFVDSQTTDWIDVFDPVCSHESQCFCLRTIFVHSLRKRCSPVFRKQQPPSSSKPSMQLLTHTSPGAAPVSSEGSGSLWSTRLWLADASLLLHDPCIGSSTSFARMQMLLRAV